MVDMPRSNRSHGISPADIPTYLRLTGTFVRSLFIVTMIAIIWSISVPRSSAALAHFSAADYARTGIGIATCIGMLVQLLRLPKDGYAYKTWTHIGAGLGFVLLVFMSLSLALGGTS